MVFLERSHIRSAALVDQFPRQGTPYEARELPFADLCADGCGQRAALTSKASGPRSCAAPAKPQSVYDQQLMDSTHEQVQNTE
jgi:hypothetical protein